eukprot:UN21916
MRAPKILLLNHKIYNPMFDKYGRCYFDILKDKWSPALQLKTIMRTITVILDNSYLFNEDACGDIKIVQFARDNKEEAKAKARDWTQIYATKNDKRP